VDGTTLEPASTLAPDVLAALFNAGYEDYYVPVHLDAELLARHLEHGDVDLDASRIALRDGRPIGFCVLGVRGDEGWIGGMGVAAGERRSGVGKVLMGAVIEEARRHGLRRIVLEVLEQNEPARRLYERLDFAHVRDLEIWTLDEAAPGDAREVPRDEAHAWIREHRMELEPWQRADGTLAHLDGVEGLAVDRGAALVRVVDGRVSLLQAAARDAGAAQALLAGARARGDTLAVLNLPPGGPIAEALQALGGRVMLRQLELALDL
jgi:ribosomal protein S18 acetylase RimI-like enzyme